MTEFSTINMFNKHYFHQMDTADLNLQTSLLMRAAALLEEDAPLIVTGENERKTSAADVLRITLWDRASSLAITCGLKAQNSEMRTRGGKVADRSSKASSSSPSKKSSGGGLEKESSGVASGEVSSITALQLQSVIERGANHILSITVRMLIYFFSVSV